ncbi:hypothetical protein [Nocardioides sp. Leaf285]|uniref:hypothetical protein n=1 Tax=Nocardioides sp. Leaf285 TaxID=1736322 RepID=UPI00070397C6|nr:hypothetical protein [Nocardioides sp. Leaf285]KQP62957.1 hypothetical protein ASF47_18265 [Nocardioides sp. Leaf285]
MTLSLNRPDASAPCGPGTPLTLPSARLGDLDVEVPVVTLDRLARDHYVWAAPGLGARIADALLLAGLMEPTRCGFVATNRLRHVMASRR